MAAENSKTDDTFDEFFVIFTERVCNELVKPYTWEAGNEDGRKNWAEYHVWKFACKLFSRLRSLISLYLVQRYEEVVIFPGEIILVEIMVNRGATMREPHIVDVYEDMRDRREALTVLWERHAKSQRDR
jgi:hypothetical protein